VVNKEALKKAQLETRHTAQTKARKQKEMLVNTARSWASWFVVGGVVWYVMRPTKEAGPSSSRGCGSAGRGSTGRGRAGRGAPMMAPPAGAPGQ